MNAQAQELNEIIQSKNSHVYTMLSKRGKNIFFPKKGILGQTAEASGCSINATIGSALENDGTVMCLPSVEKTVNLPKNEVVPYAKGAGNPSLRDHWRSMIYEKNPSLGTAPISLPVATNALTHGLSMAGYLFADEGDEIIIPHYYWGNYNLIFSETYNTKFKTFETFTDSGAFNLQGLKEAIATSNSNKKIVLLNFPNNPTGYTPTNSEYEELIALLVEAAQEGNELVVIIDDAYFGLVFEDGIADESIFAQLASAHENILAVKLDGATKEDYVWGFRVGFLTFGIKGGEDSLYGALESKVAGAVRGTISNACGLSQSILQRVYSDEAYGKEKKEKFNILKDRFVKVQEIISTHAHYEEIFTAIPYNSGYFMCVKINGAIDANTLRELLISKYSTGVIVSGDLIRIAYSSTPIDLLEQLFKNIYDAGKELL